MVLLNQLSGRASNPLAVAAYVALPPPDAAVGAIKTPISSASRL